MKFSILIAMLFDLLAKRKVTAVYLAEKYQLSVRTVYRYIDHMSLKIPVYIRRGRNGGICIPDNFKLPVGFMTKEEYESAISALETMYAQLPEQRFLDAKEKLSAQWKTENRELALSGTLGTILIDSGTWGDTKTFSEKLRLMEECIQERTLVEVIYQDRNGARTERVIEPHMLVFKQGVWYVYAYCRVKKEFRLFRLGRMISTFVLNTQFLRREFKKEDIPLNFWTDESACVDAVLEISADAFADAQDWLGGENLTQKDGVWIAEVTLPDDESLPKKIVGLGAGVKVLSPTALQEKVKAYLSAVQKRYE